MAKYKCKKCGSKMKKEFKLKQGTLTISYPDSHKFNVIRGIDMNKTATISLEEYIQKEEELKRLRHLENAIELALKQCSNETIDQFLERANISRANEFKRNVGIK